MIGFNHPKLRELVELVQDSYRVRVGAVWPDYKNNTLLFYTDSPYKGLNKLSFNVTEKNEENDLQTQLEKLKKNPQEAAMLAKVCMLNYWVEEHPNLKPAREYEKLLDLTSNKDVTIERFEKAIKRYPWYNLPVEFVVKKVIEPIAVIRKGKRKAILYKHLVEKIETETIPLFTTGELTADPVEYGKSLCAESKPEQERLEKESDRLAKELHERFKEYSERYIS